MKKLIFITLLGCLSAHHNNNAMQRVVSWFITPTIINSKELTENQQAEIRPAYQEFCKRRAYETNIKTVKYGIPAALATAYSWCRSQSLFNQAGKSAARAIKEHANGSNFVIVGAVDMALSGKTWKGIGLLGMSVPCGLYTTYLVTRDAHDYWKYLKADNLKNLNKDLYGQLGKPTVIVHPENDWTFHMPSGTIQHVSLDSKKDMSDCLLNGKNVTTMYVPKKHAKELTIQL